MFALKAYLNHFAFKTHGCRKTLWGQGLCGRLEIPPGFGHREELAQPSFRLQSNLSSVALDCAWSNETCLCLEATGCVHQEIPTESIVWAIRVFIRIADKIKVSHWFRAGGHRPVSSRLGHRSLCPPLHNKIVVTQIYRTRSRFWIYFLQDKELILLEDTGQTSPWGYIAPCPPDKLWISSSVYPGVA